MVVVSVTVVVAVVVVFVSVTVVVFVVNVVVSVTVVVLVCNVFVFFSGVDSLSKGRQEANFAPGEFKIIMIIMFYQLGDSF